MDESPIDTTAAPVTRMRVLVLGSAGFIGARVVSALAASDWALPVAAFRQTPPKLGAGIESRAVDATSTESLAQALVGVDAVVNCVNGDGRVLADSARSLFQAAAQCSPVPRVVHLSSMAVYGNVSGDIGEGTPLNGEFGPYAAAKVDAETAAGLCPNAVCLRPGVVYGAGGRQWSEDLARLLLARRLGDLGAAGEGYCNPVHVDDVVAAILASLRKPEVAGRTYNLAMSRRLDWNEYLRLYAGALGVSPVPVIGKLRLKLELKLLAPALKILEILLNKLKLAAVIRPPALIPPSMGRLFRQTIRLDSRKAEQDLGLRWKPLEDGLAEAAAVYRGK